MGFNGKKVFVVGSGRSGTTWLQLLLFQHPAVASCQETHIFDQYLSQLEATWKRQMGTPRKIGLPAVLSQAEFEALMRDCARSVFDQIASSTTNAQVLVEKTPSHVHKWELILRLFPDAYFLHIIRDPRSVVCSMRSAGSTWGRRWAPTSVIDGTKGWLSAVRSGSRIPLATERYKEVIYEKLLSDGPQQLSEIFAWLDLEADLEFCDSTIKACSIDNLRSASKQIAAPWSLEREPSGFYGQGLAEGWHTVLSKSELKVVEYLAGDLMEELEYVRATPSKRGKPPRLVLEDVMASLSGFLVFVISRISPRLRRSLGRAVRQNL